MIFYVYFDNDTRDVLSISNEKNSTTNTYVEKSREFVEDFIQGTKNFNDYKFDSDFNFVLKNTQSKDVVSHTFVEIVPSGKSDLVITHSKNWHFCFAKEVKNINGNLMFAITQKNNPNLLIRTINFQSQLAYEGHLVDFKYDSEKDTSNISLWAIHPPYRTASLIEQ